MTIRMTGLALVAVLALAGCRVEVYDNLPQRDANEIAALLLSANIDAKRIEDKDGTFAVEVREKQFAMAVQLISESGLPRPQYASMDQMFETDRLIESPSGERARLAYATSQELSRTVSEIDGVVSSRVHLATPEVDPLGRRITKSSASVAIHHESGLETDGLVPRIKLLVSHAVDDLEYEDVLVALFPVKQMRTDASGQRREVVNSAPGLLDEMIWPSGNGSNSGSSLSQNRVVQASPSAAEVMNPAIAAILAGGLIVLLIAAKGLFENPRRSRAQADGGDTVEVARTRNRADRK